MIIALMVLVILNALFWAVYEQQGNTLQIFADRNADWHIFGFEMPSTWFQAVNPMFIFALTPLLISYWGWQYCAAAKNPAASLRWLWDAFCWACRSCP